MQATLKNKNQIQINKFDLKINQVKMKKIQTNLSIELYVPRNTILRSFQPSYWSNLIQFLSSLPSSFHHLHTHKNRR